MAGTPSAEEDFSPYDVTRARGKKSARKFYVGIADAYRACALSSAEQSPTEFMPKARTAAQKAIEIDEALAEAHASLGTTIFWYDWDWAAAEKQLRRALELNPNLPAAHLGYAHYYLGVEKYAEAVAASKRSRELDPLNLRLNVLEGSFLIYAGQTDEALFRLRKTFELDENYWFAHMFASSAYIEKGMFADATAEARKARELSGASSFPTTLLGYALAKSGKQAEAENELQDLLKQSKERYISPYHIAMIYHGLGRRDDTLAWLEKGYQQRDPKMIFLKAEPNGKISATMRGSRTCCVELVCPLKNASGSLF